MPAERLFSFQDLVVTGERQGSDHRFVVSGELDLASAPVLEHALMGVEHADAGSIVVDLAGVTFMDLIGLHLLSRAELRACASGSQWRVASPAPAVARILALSGSQPGAPPPPLETPAPATQRDAQAA